MAAYSAAMMATLRHAARLRCWRGRGMRHQHLPFEMTGPHTSRRSRINRWWAYLLILAAILGAALALH